MALTAEDIVRLFKEDAKARKCLAKLLVGEPNTRLAIIDAVLRDAATKEDIEKLREEMQDLCEQVCPHREPLRHDS